jgi:hypothetical protein
MLIVDTDAACGTSIPSLGAARKLPDTLGLILRHALAAPVEAAEF